MNSELKAQILYYPMEVLMTCPEVFKREGINMSAYTREGNCHGTTAKGQILRAPNYRFTWYDRSP